MINHALLWTCASLTFCLQPCATAQAVETRGVERRGAETGSVGATHAAADAIVTIDRSGALGKFADLRSRQQELVLAAVREAAAATGALAGLADDAAGQRETALRSARKLARRRTRGGRSPHDAVDARLPFPMDVQYSWGDRTIASVDTRSRLPNREAEARRTHELQAMLSGLPADSDLLYARLLQRLDNDHNFDDFARFLATWRNGDEPFYDALDRTAGTGDSVFFFDLMLDDFVAEVVPRRHPDNKALRRSLDATQHALHTTFLGYRQYRGLREAIALSMLLPPDQPLPGPLARYEQGSPGGYSIREQIEMLLLAADGDALQVADWVVAAAPPVPANPWAQRYDPFTDGFQRVFQERLDEILAHGQDTDRALVEARRLRRQQSAERALAGIAAIARTARR